MRSQFILYTHQLYAVTPRCIPLILLEVIPPYDDITPFLTVTGIEDTFNGSSLSLSSHD
jgi:hypothetical protein